FNGTNQEIRYSVDGGFMESAYSQISFSAWIKPDNVSGNRIIYEEGGNSNGSALWLNDGLLTYTTRAASSSFNQIDVTVGDALTVDNKWHHVAATFDNGTLTVYLDGVSNSIQADYNTVPAHGDPGGVGGTIGNGSSAVDDGVPVENYSGLMDAARYDNTTAWSLSRIRNEATLFLDTDGDGISNHLDLDSDDDGCSDANEYYNNLGADGGDGGVYGAGAPTVDADGLVVGAEYNGSGYSAVIDDNTSICKDTDGDGIADILDLDADNDGILNEDECGIDKQTDVFSYTGSDQVYTIPTGASHLKVKIWGAGG
ncbi:LamG domain-containing protein, partial [Psychroflexus sp. YR1-1]